MRDFVVAFGAVLLLLPIEEGFAVGRTICASSYASDITVLEHYQNLVDQDSSTRMQSLDVYFANSAKAHDRDYVMTADMLRREFIVHTRTDRGSAAIYRYLISRFESIGAADWQDFESLTTSDHSRAPEVAYVLDFALDAGEILSIVGTFDRLVDPEAKRGVLIDCQIFNILEATTRLPEWPVEDSKIGDARHSN